VTDPSVQAKQPAFSPDGTLLAYAAQVDGVYQIHVQDLESGNVEQVTDLSEGATYPAFSPDGVQMAFVTGDPETSGSSPDTGSLMLVDLETLEVTLVSDREVLGCCYPQYLAPVFNGPNEILVGSGLSLVGIDLSSGDIRDLVPLTGRIPNPQDPSPAPDGIRYVFSDFCGVEGIGLYVARLDGSSGDTCAGAVAIQTGHRMISADWGPQGFIAAEIDSTSHGVLFIDDTDFSVTPFTSIGSRNPAWAPAGVQVPVSCE
jgi:WD40 repeat protein